MVYAGAGLGVGVLVVLAQTDPSPVPTFVNAGVLGAVALVFIFGWVVPAKLLDLERARADRAEARSEAMLEDYKAVVPVLERALAALQQSDARADARAAQDADTRVLLAQFRDALEAVRRQ